MLHYVWAEARRRTHSPSRSRSLLVKWRAHEQSNSLSPGWSAELLCARGTAVATHTPVSQAKTKQTRNSQGQVIMRSVFLKSKIVLFSLSSAEEGKFLCAQFKSEFKTCMCRQDL